MRKKKPTSNRHAEIKVGNITDVGGSVNIAGGDINTSESNAGLTVMDLEKLFGQVYSVVDQSANITPATKGDLKSDIKEIQTTVTDAVKKKGKVDESFLASRFRNIARMAPDILDVMVATLANPLAGLGVAVKKIAEKAKQDIGQV